MCWRSLLDKERQKGDKADTMTNKKENKQGDKRKQKGDKADTVTNKQGDKKGDKRKTRRTQRPTRRETQEGRQ